MGELKPGWRRFSFTQMVTSAPRKARGWNARGEGIERYVGLEHLDSNSLKIRRWGDPDDVGRNSDLRVFEPGDVILSRRGIELRKVGLAEFRGVASGHALVFRAQADVVLPGFLGYFVQSDAFMGRADGFSVGSLSRTVNLSALMDEEFALPPLEEQRQHVEVLDTAECALQSLLNARRSVNDITRRLLEAFDISRLPFVSIEELVTDGPQNGVSPQCNDQQRGRPTLPVGCVYTGVVNTSSDLKFSEIDDATFEKFRLRKDDVLVVRGNGNRESVGRAGIVVEDKSECFYPDLLIRLRFDGTKLAPELAVHLWNCVPVHGSLIRRAKSTNGIYKINGADIRAHRLPLPPNAMQAAMLDAICTHGKAVRSVDERVVATRRVKSQLLGQLAGAA
jgi:type I restriction enzyme S subunit